MVDIIGIFDIYFMIFMILQGIVAIFIDAPTFKKNKMNKLNIQSKVLGIIIILIGIALYIINIISI
ncbi:hypothetical protein FDF74_09365 [Clostridium niameyense]|uniref:Uncharacterized protein n=1 Tax=Clostridium niameyense TaxID=1622073 RepID=A0A6M0RAV9_9CLOT|nr:CLC_0170 family protein [Clostridium niameyense]NEZ47401.1 hypothetical protein [Clostridium niameyense]